MSAPYSVAQLIVPSDGLVATGAVYLVPDWLRGRLYVVNSNFIRTYTTEKATQNPLRSVALTGITHYNNGPPGVDLLTGDILMFGGFPGHPEGNTMPVFRVDPATGTVGNWDGVASPLGDYPTGYWAPEGVVGVACSGISYAVVKEDSLEGIVAVARMSTPADHAGHGGDIVRNNRNNRANICAGASGAGGASAFLIDTNNPGQTTANVYYVRIAAGAETYNPATWPTANTFITSGILATIPMGSINSAWTQIVGAGIAYDQTDGNVIASFNNAVSSPQRLTKINASTGAIMWVTEANIHAHNLQASRLADGHIWLPGGGLNGSTVIDTATGTPTVTPLTGLSFSEPTVVCDGASLVAFAGSYTASGTGAGTNPADPAPGTSSFSGGYGLLWPNVPPSLAMDNVVATATTTLLQKNLISLRWSDDRGESYGSPVSRSIGRAGEYLTSLQWLRLGMTRDRVFELSWSVPMHTALQGCWVDVTPAQS